MFDPNVIVDIDPIQHRALNPFVRRSQEFQIVLRSHANRRIKYKGAFIAALGNDLRALPNAYNVTITGKPTIGAVFF
jgi:hypothetical protein